MHGGSDTTGWRVKRIQSEARCKCCRGDLRDTTERWLLLRRLRGFEQDGSRVTTEWMIEQSEIRLGIRIGRESWDNHAKKHCEIIRDESVVELAKTDADRAREEFAELEDVSHTEMLEMVVRAGAAKVKANPDSVSPELGVQAAKVLAGLKVDEDRMQMLRQIAGSFARRPSVGEPEIRRELEPAITVEAEEVA